MSLHDLYLISPQLTMAGLGILVILLDLVTGRKGWLAAAAFTGLAAPLLLILLQLSELVGFSGPDWGNLTPEGSILAQSLSVDRFGLFFNLLVVIAAALVILASVDYVKGLARLQGEFYGLLLLSASGMMLLASATELITIYVALELTTLPLAALAAFLMNARSSEAGMKFLVTGAISSALTLYGMALVFGFTGSTGLAGIAAGLEQAAAQPNLPFGSYAILTGVSLLTVGIAFKLSAVPSQMWVPDVYEGAPAPVVAFLSVASKAVAFALLLRVIYTGFPEAAGEWGILLAVLAAVSMTVGNLVAITQSNIRRLLGYSAIAHAGYLLVGMAAAAGAGNAAGAAQTQPGVALVPAGFLIGPSSVLFYLAAYTAANLTAFFAIIAIGRRIGSDRIEDYAGMVRRSPFLAAALALALIALIGVPPTGIFVAKIYVFTAAVKSGLAWLAVLGVINSVISAYYYVRIIRVMFLRPGPEAPPEPATGAAAMAPPADAGPASGLTALAVAIAALVTVLLGLAPGPLLKAAESAVTALLGVTLR